MTKTIDDTRERLQLQKIRDIAKKLGDKQLEELVNLYQSADLISYDKISQALATYAEAKRSLYERAAKEAKNLIIWSC